MDMMLLISSEVSIVAGLIEESRFSIKHLRTLSLLAANMALITLMEISLATSSLNDRGMSMCSLCIMKAHLAGLEPAAYRLEICYSIRLSYRCFVGRSIALIRIVSSLVMKYFGLEA